MSENKLSTKHTQTLLTTLLILTSWQAQATPYRFDTPSFGLPGFSGNGLLSSVWSNVLFPAHLEDRTISWVHAYQAITTASSAFVSTSVDYPKGPAVDTVRDETTTISQLLGEDAATLTNPGIGSNKVLSQTGSIVNGTIMRFAGYYRVDNPGSVFFNIASDDGVSIKISGIEVAVQDGIHAFGTLPNPVEVEFTTAGLYSLQIDWFDGEHVDAGILFGTGDPIGAIGQSQLYRSPIPEPTTVILVGIGLSVLVEFRRKRSFI